MEELYNLKLSKRYIGLTPKELQEKLDYFNSVKEYEMWGFDMDIKPDFDYDEYDCCNGPNGLYNLEVSATIGFTKLDRLNNSLENVKLRLLEVLDSA